MRLLIDTHALLWLLLEPAKLSKRARKALADPATDVLVSAATAWEISTKFRIGKLDDAGEVVRSYAEHLRVARIGELAITSAHALLAGSFRRVHKDPFDRLIAAQGTLEALPIVSTDPTFADFPVTLLW